MTGRVCSEHRNVDPLPLISCIVPVFNGERFLAQALDSIFEQTYRPIEVIVIDDGSTDRSGEIVVEYGERIKYQWQDNAGPAAARNRGIELADGEFIAFLDSDDLWHRKKLERQMARFVERPELGLSLTYKRNFWEQERRDEEERLKRKQHAFVEEHPGYGCPMHLVRKSVFDRVGGFDESLRIGEDSDWLTRTREHGIVCEMLPEVMVFRRMHAANLSLTATAEDRLTVVAKKLKRHQSSTAPAPSAPPATDETTAEG